MSPRLSVTSPISGSGVPLLPSVAQRRSCFNSNEERHHPDGDRQNSTSSTNCDYDSDASSLVVDKLGYEADTSSVVTSERDVTPTLDLNYEAIKEESSADENSRTPVNELGSLSFNSDHVSSSSSTNDQSPISHVKRRSLSSIDSGSNALPIHQKKSSKGTKKVSQPSSMNIEIANKFQDHALPLLTDSKEHCSIDSNDSRSQYNHELSSESTELDRSSLDKGEIEERIFEPPIKPRALVERSSNKNADLDQNAFIRGFIPKRKTTVSPGHEKPVVKVIEHNILSEIANTVSETQSSPHCEDESRSYTSSDIESSSDSSNNEDLRNSVNSRGAPKNVVSPISHKLISPQRSTSSNQSLLSTSSSEFDRTAAVRGSLTMRGSYSSRVPEQSKKEPHKIHERKHSDRTPFVLQL